MRMVKPIATDIKWQIRLAHQNGRHTSSLYTTSCPINHEWDGHNRTIANHANMQQSYAAGVGR